MDKQTIIDLTLAKPYDGDLIFEYCIEMGKEESETIKFINLLIFTPYYNYCFKHALDYYQKKFNIILLHDKNGNLITAY